LTRAENENILLADELHLKSEQWKVIANAYDDEQAQTLQHNRFLQEQLDLAKTKYDVVHSKLDSSVELSTNRSNLITCRQFCWTLLTVTMF
jgi:hypothetical protein